MDGEDVDGEDCDEDGNAPEFTSISSPPKTPRKPVRLNLLVDAAWGAVMQLQKNMSGILKMCFCLARITLSGGMFLFSKDNF